MMLISFSGNAALASCAREMPRFQRENQRIPQRRLGSDVLFSLILANEEVDAIRAATSDEAEMFTDIISENRVYSKPILLVFISSRSVGNQ
jgi:hypothetical protein